MPDRRLLSAVDDPRRTFQASNGHGDEKIIEPLMSESADPFVILKGEECLSRASNTQATVWSDVGIRNNFPMPGSAEMRKHFFLKQEALNFNASYGTPVREVRRYYFVCNSPPRLSAIFSSFTLTSRFLRSNGCIRLSASQARTNGCSEMRQCEFKIHERK